MHVCFLLHVCLCDAAAVLSFFPFVHVMSVVSGFDDLVQSGADPFFFQDSLRVVLIVHVLWPLLPLLPAKFLMDWHEWEFAVVDNYGSSEAKPGNTNGRIAA